MLCNICHKNEATIHFKGIFNDQTFKVNICEECVKKKGVEIKPELALAKFISTLSDFDGFPLPETFEKKSLTCQTCNLTYTEFKQTGRLGCGNCYSAFGHYLMPLIERLHGSNKYVGKKNTATTTNDEVQSKDSEDGELNLLKQKYTELKKQLENALKKEQYELAAELRDKSNQIKSYIKDKPDETQ